ncbi:MAG: hypothetical protein ABL958_16020, partial [Bdellovibrionia bacterium]
MRRPVVSRRQALSMMGLCGFAGTVRGPAELLVNGLVDGLFAKAQAQATGQVPRNHVFVNLIGGPPRWFWDLPLSPYDGLLPMIRNPHVNTRFASGGVSAGVPEYTTTTLEVRGERLHMPSLWDSEIPTRGGGYAPMAELLPNMLMIRGVNMRMDGHPDNNERQIRPSLAGPSLNGLAADRSPRPLPAVGLPGGPTAAYKSASGVGQVTIGNYSDPLRAILQPFDRSGDSFSTGYLSRRDALDAALGQAMRALGSYARSSGAGAENLEKIRGAAEGLLKRGIGDVSAEYAQLSLKYRDLVARCTADTVQGVNDLPVDFASLRNIGGYTPQTTINEG